jgi:hypothetical protein
MKGAAVVEPDAALIVMRFPSVIASLANMASVTNTPPVLEGGLEIASDGCLLSTYAHQSE